MSLGATISIRRKKLGFTQKDLAKRIRKEDGGVITAQYLNDIEHDRRAPNSPLMIEQFAKALQMPPAALYFHSGTLPVPAHLQGRTISDETVVAAYQAFQRKLEGEE